MDDAFSFRLEILMEPLGSGLAYCITSILLGTAGVRSCLLHNLDFVEMLRKWPERYALNSKARCIT